MKFNGQLTGPFPILDRVSHSAVLAGLELCVDRLCLLSMGVRGVHHCVQLPSPILSLRHIVEPRAGHAFQLAQCFASVHTALKEEARWCTPGIQHLGGGGRRLEILDCVLCISSEMEGSQDYMRPWVEAGMMTKQVRELVAKPQKLQQRRDTRCPKKRGGGLF